jgi:uncharacterized protein (TIGR03083 family)
MTLDYRSIISDEGARIVAAYERDRTAPIPWSDRWTVGTVARHVAGTHHVVAQIIEGRPEADFGLFGSLVTPAKDSPEFIGWFRAGTASLIEQLSSVPSDDQCWSWYEPGGHVGWWGRRMALEAVVHRSDTDLAEGHAFALAPETAADGIDEYLDVFVAASRAGTSAPAGPTIRFECTDRDDQWLLDLSQQGERILHRGEGSAALLVRGSAEQLLLALWGRAPMDHTAGIEASGDIGWLSQWSTLIPPM